ncbi:MULTISPECIES: proton-conducting transporter membrane subunit [unclassified Pseudoalteromonas]|uniref:complex I subunit 5 family protein n=1 Tax=unclassified Pseudoalteromonas TaxID=194690 RepID=UPI002097A583|nr:proton-conducting transporter membrane subunit [Pseudoalteromonas sp. XMcav2-N]MCO7187987.1 oxidoreductase [Pseudoalteromonas sp. XMcav2-N]
MPVIDVASLLPLLIAIPLIGAIFSVLLSTKYAQVLIGLLSALALVLVIGLILVNLPSVDTEFTTPLRYVLAGWEAPLGIALSLDGFSALLLSLTVFLVTVLTFYSAFYFAASPARVRFWPLWWLLVAGINALFLSADIFNVYVTLEIIGLAAVALVALSGNKAGLTAALRYLLVGLLGSLCYLLAVALLYHVYGTLDFAQLAAKAESNPLSWAALALITVGLVLKTALVPLHFWLPHAHGSAPAPVSAILSALVVKASFYLLVRFWMEILAPAVTNEALMLLGILGGTAILWGCVQALRAKRLKLMVAYSTVAQIGYLFLLFPLLMSTEEASASQLAAQQQSALAAVSYFIVAHACAKAAMFIAAGNIIHSLGHDDIAKLQGMAKYMPLSLFTFAIAGGSLIGLPPSAGFIAKWLLLNVAIDTHQWWWVVIILTGGLLAALAIFRVLDQAFIKPEQASDHVAPDNWQKVPVAMPVSGLALALCTMALGFNADLIIDLIAIEGGE